MRINRDRWVAIALIAPSLIAVGIFVYGFIAWSLRVSLSDWQGLIPSYNFVGLRNYAHLIFDDRRFHIGVRNTAVFTTVFLSAAIVVGLMLALLIDRKLPAEGFFRNVFLFPMAVSFIVTGVAWRWLMNPATGGRTSGLNLLLDHAGLGFLQNSWHSTAPPWGIAFVGIPAMWQMAGFAMALFLAGLRAIPDDLREAARVDGAGERQVYRHVILPLLRPALLSAVIILGHISLKIFDLIVAMGRSTALDVPSIYMWNTTFDANNYSRGAAIGIMMLVSVAVLVVPYLIYARRQEAEL
ncbi:MAG TPA: sugar ABC transporter permease [Egibacteraceae bacterium]|nr:sugar ABC transporter permease [Egibacteraceae bacterium]